MIGKPVGCRTVARRRSHGGIRGMDRTAMPMPSQPEAQRRIGLPFRDQCGEQGRVGRRPNRLYRRRDRGRGFAQRPIATEANRPNGVARLAILTA